jgi:stage II sporulation protein D
MKYKIILSTIFYFIFLPCRLAPSLIPQGGILNARPCLLSYQIKVRLFTEQNPDIAIFTVNSGLYKISNGTGWSVEAVVDDPLIIARFNSKILIKQFNKEVIICDSVDFNGETGTDCFSMRIIEPEAVKRSYSGDLKCFSDMETLLLINTFDIEKYIAGVVKAEGGSGKDGEYFKTQAVIARTYTYKYFTKHSVDGYNLCDDTHCQAFNGKVDDSLIINAVLSTKGLVITTPDSNLIISAFHSNCGGETSPSEYAWVTGQSYLKRTVDPYCGNSRNAHWEKYLSISNWMDFLKKNSFQGNISDTSLLNFEQPSRAQNYQVGSFSIPLRTLRAGFDLRSTFFSVKVRGDSILLNGRGYGHGVGLCQEGAMNMASKGFNFEKIIKFYYSGVSIMKIEDAKKIGEDK